jgi:hypothetical protein
VRIGQFSGPPGGGRGLNLKPDPEAIVPAGAPADCTAIDQHQAVAPDGPLSVQRGRLEPRARVRHLNPRAAGVGTDPQADRTVLSIPGMHDRVRDELRGEQDGELRLAG